MARKPLTDFSRSDQAAGIVVPPLPTEAQIQQMLQNARERDEHIRRERAAVRPSPGSAKSLSEFCDAFYYANADRAVWVYRRDGTNRDLDNQILRNLRKAAIHVACGPYAQAMRAAAQAWQIDTAAPRAPSYTRLKATMLVSNPPPLTKSQITRAITRIRKDLEMWLRAQYPQLCPYYDKHAAMQARREQRLAKREQKLQQQAIKRQQRFERQERRMLDRMDTAWRKAQNRN
jgi:hypothetical protein